MIDTEKEECRSEIEQHLTRNKEAQVHKASDKQRANNEKTYMSVTFDLQSVLQVPSSDASLMYCSENKKMMATKSIIFLLVPPAIEQAEPNDGHCYLWSKVEGKWCSNEIGSCMLQYLQSLPKTVRKISMFSDTCGL